MLFPLPRAPKRPHRVVITGSGIVTALGIGYRVNANGFRVGSAAFRPVTLFDVARQRAQFAAEVTLPDELPATRLNGRSVRRLDRAARMLLWAAHEAWTESGWTPATNLPVVLGTTAGGMTLGERYLCQALRAPKCFRHQPTRAVCYQAQEQAQELGSAFGFQGPSVIISNACASGANAIGHAFDLLRSGRAERVLAGGYDALCQLTFAGFDSLQALSMTPCRPFDSQRDGLSLGEGAAMLALETLEHAERRGAVILAELAGYAAATDNHHLTQPHPEGHAALATMRGACEQAGITPAAVDYMNAHGTGTLQNDSTEATAINAWAGDCVGALPVSSTKANIGHLLGAAGAVEAVVCLMAVRGGWLPPQRPLAAPDPLCRFRIVQQPTAAPVRVALSNSFGFGGANATLILREWP